MSVLYYWYFSVLYTVHLTTVYVKTLFDFVKYISDDKQNFVKTKFKIHELLNVYNLYYQNSTYFTRFFINRLSYLLLYCTQI